MDKSECESTGIQVGDGETTLESKTMESHFKKASSHLSGLLVNSGPRCISANSSISLMMQLQPCLRP